MAALSPVPDGSAPISAADTGLVMTVWLIWFNALADKVAELEKRIEALEP